MIAPPSLDTFQHEAVDFFDAARGRVIYADPLGARKTGTTLSWLDHASPGRTLVVAPKAVHGHWLREAARFFPDARTVHYQGSPAQRAKLLDEFGGESLQPIIAITSYATMSNDVAYFAKKNLLGAVVFDEGHRLKGRRTGVALAANSLTKDVQHVICATGTPILNHPAELWQYLHMLYPKEYRSFWAWAEEHFNVELKQFRGQRQATRIIHDFREGHEEIVRNQLIGILLQRELHELFNVEEHPWIVEPEHVIVPVTLSPAERKAYDKMAKSFWARLPGGTLVNAGNALVAGTRLQQFASEWGTLDDTLPNGAKVASAAELIPDLTRRAPVIVFAKYKATVARLAEQLRKSKLTVASWTGDTPTVTKEAYLKQYAEGKIDVVIGTIASLGEGVDGLQYRSNQVVMLDRDWRPGINDQAIGRARRSGQSHQVVVYHLFNEGTVDESIHEANLRKVNFERTLKGQDLKDVLYGRVKFDDEYEIEVEG